MDRARLDELLNYITKLSKSATPDEAELVNDLQSIVANEARRANRKGMVIDLTGQRFGKLTALEQVGIQHGFALWRCRCDCGNETKVTSSRLRHDGTSSCGCFRPFADITGQRFGRLVALEPAGSKDHLKLWRCQCDCGNIATKAGKSLRSGATRSCGCLMGDVVRARWAKQTA